MKFLKFMVLAFLLMAASSEKQSNKIVLTQDNSVTLDGVFTPELTAKVIEKARELDSRLPSGDPIYLVLDTPGGSIDAGLELIENLKNLNRPVHTISLFSASMGFQTVQGLGERYITSNGTLMSHKAKGGFEGEFPGQVDSRYTYYLKRVTRMDERAVMRTKGKFTLTTYRALIQNEYWCDGQDCVDEGFADKIVTPSCDKSLEGTRNVLVGREMYQQHLLEMVVTKSKCPVVTGVLDTNIFVDGKPLFGNTADSLLDKNRVLNKDALEGLSLETIDNIKELFQKKIKALNERKVVTY